MPGEESLASGQARLGSVFYQTATNSLFLLFFSVCFREGQTELRGGEETHTRTCTLHTCCFHEF